LAGFRAIEFLPLSTSLFTKFKLTPQFIPSPLHFTAMATSTRSKLSIPDDGPKLEYKFFREAKKQLLEGDFLLLTDVPEDFALPLIEGLQSDPVFGSEGKYRYGIS